MANFTYLQLFQSFLAEVVQNDLEWPILPIWHQSFPTEVVLNDSEGLILPVLQIFSH